MSALEKAMGNIDKACGCHEDMDRCTVSVRGGDVDRSMFWIVACDDCAPLRRAAIEREFPGDVTVVTWPEGRRALPVEEQLNLLGGAS